MSVEQLDQLPDDPALLKAMIFRHVRALELADLQIDRIGKESAAAVAARDAQIEQHVSAIEQIKQEAAARIEAMQQRHKAEVEALLRRFYGPRSERFDVTQLLLFGRTIDTMPVDTIAVEAESGQPLATRRARNRHNHGRGLLPAHLERVPVEHDLPEAEKAGKVCIGCEISEQLEFKPGGLFVIQHRRYKYAAADYQQSDTGAQIVIADKPPQPIEKGLAGPGLLAHVIVSKLGDHLPLYRLEKIFARQDVHLASSTMCAWIAASAQLVAPLYLLMIQRVKQSKKVHTDDTRVPVQDPEVKGKCKSGRIWVYLGGRDRPYVIYEYTPDRTRAGPAKWLGDYKGYLQADAYAGYDGTYTNGLVIEVACWAHARRKFFDARDTDSARAAAMLAMIQELYAVEHEARDLSDEARRELRQEKSVPVLGKIKAWLDEQIKLVLPRSPMAGAIQYALNQWAALCRYCEAGFLEIDNNAAERAMKRVALGRKNWLFAGNDEFGQHHAVLWSLIASAERHGLDPQSYLRSVLAKIAQTPMSELDQFLPDVWKAEDAAEPKAPMR
jgi:transposase